jgi:hypothetical protein
LLPLGSNGTVVSLPQSEQITVNIWREPLLWALRAARQAGQRPGSFSKPFSAKNSCSDEEKRNSLPQSLQVKVLSVNIEKPPLFYCPSGGDNLTSH